MKVYSQLEKAQAENVTSDTASEPKGMLKYRTDTDRLKVSNGATYKEVVETDTTQTLSGKTFGDAITGIQIATPSNPAAGRNKLYFKNDDKAYTLDTSGAEKQVVDASSVQTLTNKTFGDAIIGTQIATPANPSAGTNKLYFKSDDALYTLDTLGNELVVAGTPTAATFDASRSWEFYDDLFNGNTISETGTVTYPAPNTTSRAQNIVGMASGTIADGLPGGNTGVAGIFTANYSIFSSSDWNHFFETSLYSTATIREATSQKNIVAGFTFNTGDIVVDSQHGVYFKYVNTVSAVWQAVSARDGVRTTVDTAIFPTQNVRQTLRITFVDTEALYYIDGVLVATINTNLPEVQRNLEAGVKTTKAVTSTSVPAIVIDYLHIGGSIVSGTR